MQNDYASSIDEHLSCNFVLCASLYFRLSVIDAKAQDPLFFGWHSLLHDTARDLAALSEPVVSGFDVSGQIRSGASDLLHGLQDMVELTRRSADATLCREIQTYAQRLEVQIELSSH